MRLTLCPLAEPIIRSMFALILFLAAGPVAFAIAIFPANVQNNTPVAVEITVVRVQTRMGSPATTNEARVAIQPGQHASVMIMGGTFGTGASFTKQITVSQASASEAQAVTKPIAPPLVLDNPTSTMVREFVVEVDAKTGQFKFEPTPPKAATETAGIFDAVPTNPAPSRVKPANPQASMHIVYLAPATDARTETSRLESAFNFKATYVYTAAAHGFAASLTQEQVKKLKAESTVLSVQADRMLHLDSSVGPQ
jgi:hypothetical protein